MKPHDMRRAAATLYNINGLSLPEIQELLGHANVKTTRAYINVSHSDLTERFAKCSPVDRLLAG